MKRFRDSTSSLDSSSDDSSGGCGSSNGGCFGFLGGQKQNGGLNRRPFDAKTNTLTDGERLLANEMNSLTIDDRAQVFEDIHGVNDIIEETPELIQQKLEELEVELQGVRKKEAYTKAAFLSPYAVKNRTMRIKLLRTARWKADRAAKLITKFFEAKLHLFGPDKLVRPLLWTDLDGDAHISLEAGAVVQYEAGTSLSDRRILILNYASFKYETTLSLLQSIWYAAGMAPSSSTTEKKGMITIVNTVGATAAQFFLAIKSSQTMAKIGVSDDLPMRFSSNHFCFQDQRLRPYFSMLLMTISKEIRLRTKFHFGSALEVMYELGTYGIPLKLLPLDVNGIPKLDVIQTHLKQIRAWETELWNEYMDGKPANCIHRPLNTDVCLGRGWPYQSFPGNVAFMQFLEDQKKLYDDAPSRIEKTMVSATLVVRIKQMGVRFLKRDDTGLFWEEVSDTAARQKVAMSMRNIARR